MSPNHHRPSAANHSDRSIQNVSTLPKGKCFVCYPSSKHDRYPLRGPKWPEQPDATSASLSANICAPAIIKRNRLLYS